MTLKLKKWGNSKKGTIDERIMKALELKDTSQSALIDAVKASL